MKKHFSLHGQAFENALWKLQGAETQSEFAAVLAKVRRDYGDPVGNIRIFNLH